MNTPTKPAALRLFEPQDWDAFSGAESENPQIAQWDDGTVLILDGAMIDLYTHDSEGDLTGSWHLEEPNPVAAESAAFALVETINETGDPAGAAKERGMSDEIMRWEVEKAEQDAGWDPNP